MVGGLVAVSGGLQFAGMLFGVSHQILQGVELAVGSHQDDGGLGHVVADGHEIVHGVVTQALDDVGAQGGQVHEAEGVAVGLGLGKGSPADGAGAAFLVVDHHGLAQELVGVGAEDAGGVVGAGTGLIGHDHVDGFAGGPAGGFGLLGLAAAVGGGRGVLVGAVIAAAVVPAAGSQAQHHQSCQQKGKKLLLHLASTFLFVFPRKLRGIRKRITCELNKINSKSVKY